MSRVTRAEELHQTENSRDLASSVAVSDTGAQFACSGGNRGVTRGVTSVWNALLLLAASAVFGAALSGCVVTDPVDFKDEVDVPPSILDDPTFHNGSIIKFEKVEGNAPGAKEIEIDLRIRDENVSQPLAVRTRITTSKGVTFIATCPDILLARQGVPTSDYKLTIPQAYLNAGECHKVEVAVSGHFDPCSRDAAETNKHFGTPAFDHADDIARATYWIWEDGKNVLADPMAAQALLNSCGAIEYSPPSDGVTTP